MKGKLKFGITALVLGGSYLLAQDAVAIPSPRNHTHINKTVHWKEPGSPPLPWTNAVANMWNHNHLTDDPFNNAPSFIINKAWDNRTLHNSLTGTSQFGHGMILSGNAVRYGFTGDVPNDARDVVEAAFNSWITEATVQYNIHKDPWDILAIDFDRATQQEQNNNDFEVTIDFDPNLAAYGEFDGVDTVTFLTRPDPTFDFATINEVFNLGIANPIGWDMRFGNIGPWQSVLGYSAPWSFDGTPEVVINDQDIDFRDPMGNIFESIGGVDTIDLTEMDFATIAIHEAGHVIALGHPGDPTDSIMRTNIFRDAIFGRTKQIDNDSALGVAIDYTYAQIPEPSTLLSTMGFGILGIISKVWKGRKIRTKS